VTPARLLHLVPALLLLSACALPGMGSDGADPDEAEDALLGQRDEVAATAETLVDAVAAELGGRVEVVETQGAWDGCTSIFPEGYADFQYAGRVQLRASGAPERLGAELARAAESSGLEVVEVSDDAVRVQDGDVTARVWDLPRVNTAGDVSIELTAHPCVDVPRSDWEDWMRRDDPGPEVGPEAGG
jgi:hypothetical protein